MDSSSKLSRPGKWNGMYGVRRYGSENPFFGHKHSEETKDKIRLAKLGRKQSEEANKKRSLTQKGRPATWLKGKSLSAEHREKLRKSVPRGADSPHWRGGKRLGDRRSIRETPEYREWRKSVFKRDGWTCVMCLKKGGTIHADHIIPVCLEPLRIHDLSNGRTLCWDCHRRTDSYGRSKALREAMKHRGSYGT